MSNRVCTFCDRRHPNGWHCRAEVDYWREKAKDLQTVIDTPEISAFFEAVRKEAAHQRLRWGNSHDAQKTPEDWFWCLGYLSGKALSAAKHGDKEKELHHTISSAALLANWHAASIGAWAIKENDDASDTGTRGQGVVPTGSGPGERLPGDPLGQPGVPAAGEHESGDASQAGS